MNGCDCYKAVLELMTEGCVITDSEGRHVFFNNAYVQLSGISAEYLNSYDVHQMLRKKIVTAALNPAVVKTGKVQKGTCVSRNGSTYVLTSYPLFGDDGKVQYVATLSRDISELERLKDEIQEQKRQLSAAGFGTAPAADSFVVESAVLQELMQKITYIADTPATVLLLGESGVGKSMFARRIHDMSGRRAKKFVTVDCSCLPETLIEAELVGSAPGTFTGGSSKGKIGLIEAANGGTLFLDEIGELPFHLQNRLLRVLQEKELLRMGSTSPVKIDVRFIAATNRELKKEVEEGKFRKDLYYRLNLLPITIPPLREHRDDIVPMSLNFLVKYGREYGRPMRLSDEAAGVLTAYGWPGNVRELDQFIHGLVLTLRKNIIEKKDLYSIQEKAPEILEPENPPSEEFLSNERILRSSFKELKRDFEKALLTRAVRLYKTRISLSRHLKIDRVTLFRKLKEYDISFDESENDEKM